MTIREAIAPTAASGRSLSEDEMARPSARIMDGEATPAQIGALLVAAAHERRDGRGDRRRGARDARQGHADSLRQDATVLDTCGTGGDGCGTFNISTAARARRRGGRL